jgi:hypothetical protein
MNIRRMIALGILGGKKAATEYNAACPTITPTLGADMMDTGAGVFTSGVYGWVPFSTAIVENDANTLKITNAATANGGYTTLASAGDLSANLTTGTFYQCAYDQKAELGVTVSVNIYDGGGYVYGKSEQSTSFVSRAITIRAKGATGYLALQAGTVLKAAWIDNIVFKPITFSTMFSKLVTRTSIDGTYICHPSVLNGTFVGIAAGYTNANNLLLLYTDGVYLTLDQIDGGTWSTLLNEVAYWADGDELKLVISGTTAQVFQNGTQKGADKTITAAGLGTEVHGFNTYASNSVGVVTTNP